MIEQPPSYVLKWSRGGSLLDPMDNWDERRRSDSGVELHWIDEMLASREARFDVVVASARSISAFRKTPARSHVCTFREFLQMARLFEVGSGQLEVVPRYSVNPSYYHRYRVLFHFPSVQRGRIVALTCNAQFDDVLRDQLESLQSRLNLLGQACDEVCISSLRRPDNDSESRQLYSLVYQLLLSSAALEDMAWITRYFYALNELTEFDTTLRLSVRRRSESKLTKSLFGKNDELLSFLRSELGRAYIDGVMGIRDQLQHRELPVSVGRIISGREIVPGRIELPRDAVDQIAKASGLPVETGTPFRKADNCLVDPFTFSIALYEATRNFVKGMLERFPWHEKIAAATEREQKAIQAYEQSIQAGVGNYLHWWYEPLLFQY